MLLPDVNVLVYAQREDMPSHADAKRWLETALAGTEPFGLFDPTLASFLRIVTNRRIFKTPTPLQLAFSFVAALRSAPAARPVVIASNHWNTFERLCRETPAIGDDIPDAWLAALAIDHDGELISTDRGFGRYAGLKWRKPF